MSKVVVSVHSEVAAWDASCVSYTVNYEGDAFAFGILPKEAWAVWAAAGHPWNMEDAGLVWVGDPEYGNYGLPA